MLEKPQVFRVDAAIHVPVEALLNPVLVPTLVLARLDEKLHLHLLELASAEDEVSRCYLVSKALSHLANTKWRLHTSGVQHVVEVYKDALGSLGTQVVKPRLVFDWTQRCLKEPIEVLGFGPSFFSATVRACNLGKRGWSPSLFLLEGFLKMVGTESLMAADALDKRINKGLNVTGCFPDLLGEND